MPVIDRRGKPLPDNHPLKGGVIICGVKPPKKWPRPKPEQVVQTENPTQPSDSAQSD